MKKIATILFAVVLLCQTSAFAQKSGWAGFGRYAQANAEVTTTPKAVFLGDSITDGWYSKDAEFFDSHNFLGRGISGQTTEHMLVRMQPDVIAHHPKYMVFLGGINDIAQNNGPIEVKNVFGNIVSILELAKAHKIKPIVCLLFPTDVIPWRKELGNPNDRINELNAMLTAYCKAHKIPVVEYLADIDKSSGRLPETLSRDSVHPNLDGYKIMESEILKYIK